MNKTLVTGLLKAIPMAAAIAMSAGASAASVADQYLFQWEDFGTLTGNTFKNGALIDNAVVGGDSYTGTYGLWGGTLLSSFDVSFNFYDANHVLGQTWSFHGIEGGGSLDIPFDSSASVTAIAGGTDITYTGGYYTALEFDLSNGDHYVWQFQSAVAAVPEPGTYALMLAGLGIVGFIARRRKG